MRRGGSGSGIMLLKGFINFWFFLTWDFGIFVFSFGENELIL